MRILSWITRRLFLWSPSKLLEAVSEGREDVVRRQLKCGAYVDVKDIDDRTALIQASQKGHEGIVRLLLDNGADVNLQSEIFANEFSTKITLSSPLSIASENGHEGIVRLLLDNGADVLNAKDHSSQEALVRAAAIGHKGIVVSHPVPWTQVCLMRRA